MASLQANGKLLPRIQGESLSKVPYDFPADLSAAATLLLVAFQQRQQADVNTWLATASEIAKDPDFAYFEVPMIGLRYRPARSVIDGGMRSGIPDPGVRATTVTAYQRVSRFTEPLGVEGTDEIVALLVDASGVIRWSALGALDDSQTADELRAQITNLTSG